MRRLVKIYSTMCEGHLRLSCSFFLSGCYAILRSMDCSAAEKLMNEITIEVQRLIFLVLYTAHISICLSLTDKLTMYSKRQKMIPIVNLIINGNSFHFIFFWLIFIKIYKWLNFTSIGIATTNSNYSHTTLVKFSIFQ